jgi:hypothetical protein
VFPAKEGQVPKARSTLAALSDCDVSWPGIDFARIDKQIPQSNDCTTAKRFLTESANGLELLRHTAVDTHD